MGIKLPNKQFIENYPLYKPFNYDFPRSFDDFPKPPIHVYCEVCKSEQTFTVLKDYMNYSIVSKWGILGTHNGQCDNTVILIEYTCTACRNYHKTYLVKCFKNSASGRPPYIEKIGQYPPWDISVDKELQKILADHLEVYKKGLICESQGYGIGAYAYYRRIIEDIIDSLIDSIYSLYNQNDKEKYKAEYVKIKSSKIADEKITIAKVILPDSLRPGGINPLSLLYDSLSKGLHAKNDEECLELAGDIRKMLILLVERIAKEREASKELLEIAKKLEIREKK